MSDNMLTRDQRLAKLRMQVTALSNDNLIGEINFAREEITTTPSDKHRAQMQDNLTIFAAELERRGLRLPVR
jgi:hypothetical protein